MGVSGKRHTPAALQETGWAPRPVGTGEENFSPLGFDPRALQPVTRRYTDCAFPAHEGNSDSKSIMLQDRMNERKVTGLHTRYSCIIPAL
jgi:hypothetical protein